jgi:NADH:ubiquinone oxidoreductase subunit K
MLFSIVLQFLLIGFMYDDMIPQVFVLFILLIASAEVVVVLSIVIRLYKISRIVYIQPVYFIPMEGVGETSSLISIEK